MIREEEVYSIGRISKAHGLKGEVVFSFTDDVFDRSDSDYLIIRINGIMVPFFLEEYRFRSDTTALVKFEGIDDADHARTITGCEVFFPKSIAAEHPSEEVSLNYFVGFVVREEAGHEVGRVIRVDDSTLNWLFEVERSDGSTLLIPAHESLIVDIDHAGRSLTMTLPEGLLDIDH